MDEFVKKQLERMGYNETDNGDIFRALVDINQVDFRGLTVQKIRRLVPGQASVQMDILERIEMLRVNAGLIAHAHQNSRFSSNVEGTTSPVEPSSSTKSTAQEQGSQIQSEIKPEPIDYSSGSDVEVLSSSDDESEPEESMGDSDASVKIERTPRRRKKRVHLVDVDDHASLTIRNSKVMRPSEENSERNEVSPKQLDQSESEVSTNESESQQKESSSTSTFTLIPTSTSNLRRQKPKKRHRWVAPRTTSTSTCYTLVDAKFIKRSSRILRNGYILNRDANYKVHFSVEDNASDLSIFYKHLGKHVKRLELGFWTWNPTPRHSNYSKPEKWWNTDLRKVLYNLCPKLKALTLLAKETVQAENSSNGVRNEDISTQSLTSGQIPKLPRLKEINLTNCSKDVLEQLEHIFRAADNLKRFQFAFEKVDQIEKILNLLQKVSGENCLQQLREIRILGLSDDASLNSEHFLILSMSNLVNLDSLEIACGLKDVSKESFESVLKKFSSSLKLFHCYGTFFGHDRKYFSLMVPKMEKLRYFSIGADYEFGFTEKNLNSEDGKEELTRLQDIEEGDFFNFGLQVCKMYANVETFRIGNMCTLEDLHFSSFPNLKTFEVGGPWDRMIKFPSPTSRHSSYPKIKAIQIPDGLNNMSLITEISRVFPNLTKVSMWLPSAQCLERFLKLMANSKLQELRLKTNFCFSWTLEEIFIGKVNSGARSLAEIRKLEKLKMYKYCNEYVAFHNIDFPAEMLEGEDSDQNFHSHIIEFFNEQLKSVEVEHVGRILRVPLGEHHFLDSRCEYHPEERIGFLKDYPLHTKHYLDGFNFNRRCQYDGTYRWRRQYHTKNIAVESADSENLYLQRKKHKAKPKEQKLKVRPTPALLIKTKGVKAEQQC